MAKQVLLSVFTSINGTDRSGFITSSELSMESESKDITNYGSAGWKEFLGGLKSGELKLKFLQDVAASQIDSIMFPLLGTVVAFQVRANSAAVGTSNPMYSGNILINAWNPVEGSIGDEATVSVSFPTSGAITRATA
jgi:hypothetical protein